MACRNAQNTAAVAEVEMAVTVQSKVKTVETEMSVSKLLFGVDSKVQANDILQNNISVFEWSVRNKIYPNFWGRNIVGENALTVEEIAFLHSNGCKIAAIYSEAGEKITEEQGMLAAKKIGIIALNLHIPAETAIFMEFEDSEVVSKEFMKGFAAELLRNGLTPGFKVDTDAKYGFDREFSRGLQTDRGIFEQCLIWAVAPSLAEYDRVTTTHLIHPDNWMPYAPSGITRNDIAVWQYGKNCHPIYDNEGKETTFNVNLVRNEQVILDKMF